MTPSLPVLCICGPSAAGKTTFAASLSRALQDCGRQPLLIACDDYYRQDWSPHPLFGFDTADAIDDQALRADLSAARQGQAQTLRLYDMRTRRVDRRPIQQPYDVILLEGAYGPQHLVNDFPFSGVVYLEESVPRRLWRRLRRDVRDRHRSPRYVIRQMFREMLPGERHFIQPLKQSAAVVIKDQASGLVQVLALLGSAPVDND
jgi:uridine kinase